MTDYNYYFKNTFKKYAGKWIAIKNEVVVAADEDGAKLVEKLKEKGLTLNDVSLASIPDKKHVLVY